MDEEAVSPSQLFLLDEGVGSWSLSSLLMDWYKWSARFLIRYLNNEMFAPSLKLFRDGNMKRSSSTIVSVFMVKDYTIVPRSYKYSIYLIILFEDGFYSAYHRKITDTCSRSHLHIRRSVICITQPK